MARRLVSAAGVASAASRVKAQARGCVRHQRGRGLGTLRGCGSETTSNRHATALNLSALVHRIHTGIFIRRASLAAPRRSTHGRPLRRRRVVATASPCPLPLCRHVRRSRPWVLDSSTGSRSIVPGSTQHCPRPHGGRSAGRHTPVGSQPDLRLPCTGGQGPPGVMGNIPRTGKAGATRGRGGGQRSLEAEMRCSNGPNKQAVPVWSATTEQDTEHARSGPSADSAAGSRGDRAASVSLVPVGPRAGSVALETRV